MLSQTEINPIECVSFDAGGTLIHLSESVGDSYCRIANRFGIKAESEKIEQAFRDIWKQTPPLFADPNIHADCEESWWKRLIERVFSKALDDKNFTEPETFDAFFARLYQYFAEPGVWQLDDSAIEVLDWLDANNFRIAMISNFDNRLLNILDNLGIQNRFRPLITSNEVGASKPDPRIFEHALESIGLTPDKLLHVGDDPICDGEGAAAINIPYCLVGPKFGGLERVIQILKR